MDGEARGIHVWERMGVGGREEAEECRHVNGSRKLMKSSIFELECRNPITYGQYVGNKREEVGLAEVRRVGERGGKRAAYQACKIKKKKKKEKRGRRRRSSSFSGIREVGRTLTWREALMLNCFMALKLYFLIILCAFIALLASTNE
jgi:hypothetical protein